MIILTYHNLVRQPPNVLNEVVRKWDKVSAFERQMKLLAEHFTVVPVEAIVQAVQEGRSLSRACAITFDDGYLGAYHYGAPILERFGFTAAFFIITQKVYESGKFNPDDFDRLEALLCLTAQTRLDLTEFGLGRIELVDEDGKLAFIRKLTKQLKVTPAAIKRELAASLDRQLAVPEEKIAAYLQQEAYRMMSWEEITDLHRRGFSIGSHTRTHPALSQIDGAQLEFELGGSLQDLRERLGLREVALAYPYGKAEHISAAVVAMAQRAGYGCAFTSIKESNTPATEIFQLRRLGFKDLMKMNGALNDSTTFAHHRSSPIGNEVAHEHDRATQ
ncbi:MAG: hypothetical protein ALAOOOJD_01935 [bacterium]|nr:hypothetical protein [bacterium]